MVKEGRSGFGNPTYTAWLIEAVRKVKFQKQRPSFDRICHAILQNHKVSRDSIKEQLELSVKDGSILKVYNKGLVTYKDPDRILKLRTRRLKVGKKADLTKIIVRSVKELGEVGGSTLKNIEKFILRSYKIELCDGAELSSQLRLSLKQGIRKGTLVQEGRHVKLGALSESDSVGSSSSSFQSFDEDVSSNVILPFERHKVSIIFLKFLCAVYLHK